MKREFELLQLTCPKCNGAMVLSIELIEHLLQAQEHFQQTDDLDALIEKASRGNHSPERVKFPSPPFPVALNLKDRALCFIGWCSTCNEAGMAQISPEQLEEFLGEGGVV